MTGTDIAIIGAGPYGLSIAAYLNALGLKYRIFGVPMDFWKTHMPDGMFLKSEGFASNLYDPEDNFSLRHFCGERAIPYADLGVPVPLDTFIAYGLAFQAQFVPGVERKMLVSLSRSSNGFQLEFDDGGSVTASRVIIAVGLAYFQNIPEQFNNLPPGSWSHSSEHHHLNRFKERNVAIVGGGASAIDLATLLHESGAIVSLIARTTSIKIHGQMRLPRPIWERIRWPITGIGPGWRMRFYVDMPLAFYHLPQPVRLQVVKRVLGPAAGWFMRDLIRSVPLLLGFSIKEANPSSDRVNLRLVANDGTELQKIVDHVVAATGYKIDVRRLPFLSEAIRTDLKSIEHAPILSSNFESSVPGLYFVGAASANNFGPLVRFAFGAKFTARRISSHLKNALAWANTNAHKH
jgi:thioredoxin reductase